jgi:hypothetical protein
MRFAILTLPLISWALAGCAAQPPDSPPTPTAPGPTTQAPAPQPTTTAPAPGGVAGKWSSPACGARTYERRLALEADGSFAAEDRVSPCPPNVVCVWSGIVIRRGHYAVASGAIQLAVDGTGAGPGQPLPPALSVDASGAPVEIAPDGKRCVYTRM